ncbi:MAG: SipW-dependent-type signal peptide-containing protein [Clostridia bacterium]|nr:SipW-dependent-type signal peptide-containing protein [Clostridia bacterium]
MNNTKSTKRALLASVMALFLCFTMLLGTTFAWFTDSAASGSNVITAGNLDLEVEYTLDGKNWNDLDGADDLFQKGLWEPGHTEVVALKITNAGTLALKYTANMNILNEKIGTNKDGNDIVLSEILTVGTLVQAANQVGDIAVELAFKNENMYKGTTAFKASNILEESQELFPGDAHYVIIKVDMAESVGNEANAKDKDSVPSIEFGINVLATQFTYENDSFGNQYDAGAKYPSIPDKWNGTVDTSWYNDTDTEFELTTAEQVAGLADLVDAGNTFEGKTIKLSSDLDLYAEDENGEPISFEPIGSFSDNTAFKGTFDGRGHTVSNLYQNGWALKNGYWDGPEYGMGFFSLVENAAIKNVNFDGASLPTEANIIGVVAGGAANCTFENINITGAYLGNHSWYSGGAIGWAEGDIKLINCDIDATSSVSSQWGDFNNANGGLIGGIDSASTIYLKDCDVACVIDAYNDVTSAYEWYSYRSCGMLIGDTAQMDDPDGNNVGNAIAPNLTCENVTVTYGDWANYHYCEFSSSGYPFCRVEAGESTGAYGNARVGEYVDANGNKVVDDNHVHNDGEKHNELIVFDQLYGGASGDRYCTYGTATHAGVTVIYNNK